MAATLHTLVRIQHDAPNYEENMMENEKKTYYLTEVTYTDSRSDDHGTRTEYAITEDEDDGLSVLMDEDYYFGSIIDCETRVAENWEIEEYGISE